MRIGYARVSMDDQKMDLQIEALKQAGCEDIYRDTVSGSKAERPALSTMLKTLRKGDTVMVWRLDRLGRSLKNLVTIVHGLQSKEINFVSLTESINTTTASGNLVFHMFAAIAEFERNLIRERTLAGLAASRRQGRIGGRPKSLSSEDQLMVVALYKSKKHTLKEICRMSGISKPTLYKYLDRKLG